MASLSVGVASVVGGMKAIGLDQALAQVMAHFQIKKLEETMAETFQDVLKKPLKRYRLLHPLVPDTEFEKAIDDCMDISAAGVFVLWAPQQSGKTKYLEKCAERRMKTDGQHVVVVSTYNNVDPERPDDILSNLHIAGGVQKIGESINEDQHVVFVLDAFDEAMTHFRRDALHSWVVALAQQSLHSRNFTVVLAVANVVHAETILGWNNNEKIQLCGETNNASEILDFRWNASQSEKFLGAAPEEWGSLAERQTFCKLASQCGNVATIMKMKADKTKMTEVSFLSLVESNKIVWESGVQVLAARPTAGHLQYSQHT